MSYGFGTDGSAMAKCGLVRLFYPCFVDSGDQTQIALEPSLWIAFSYANFCRI